MGSVSCASNRSGVFAAPSAIAAAAARAASALKAVAPLAISPRILVLAAMADIASIRAFTAGFLTP